MLRINGPSLTTLGLNEEQVRQMVRNMFEPVLTKPMGEVNMGELLLSGDDVLRKAGIEPPAHRSLRARWQSMRAAGRAYKEAAAANAFQHPTMRMGFLSMKQLVYLERYGRMYIPDESLLGDGEFIKLALSEPRVPAEEPPPGGPAYASS
jgi:hypothetical protein